MDDAVVEAIDGAMLPPEAPVKVLAEEEGEGSHPPAPPGHGGDPAGEEPPTISGEQAVEQAAVAEAEVEEVVVAEASRQEEDERGEEGEEEDHFAPRDSEALDYSSTTAPTEDWGGVRVDRWGFIMPQQPGGDGKGGGDDDFRKSRRFRELAHKELSRSKKWLKMLRHWDRYESVKQAKVKRRIRKGIPDALRRQAWGTLVGLQDEMKSHPTLYVDLCARTDIPDQEIHNTIERDIDRTFPRHVMFREDDSEGQRRLRRVLHAYSRHDPEVGYCQGMGFITAMLLTYFPEDEAFYMIDIIMNKRPAPIRRLYLPMMPRAQEMMFVADCVVAKFLPRLYRHLEAQGIHRSMYMTQWVVCVFTNSFPFEMVTRVWDAFLAEGWKVVYRVMVGILKHYEKDLLRKDFEKLMEFFRVLPSSVTVDASMHILDKAFQVKLKRRQLEEYERQYLQEGRAGSPT